MFAANNINGRDQFTGNEAVYTDKTNIIYKPEDIPLDYKRTLAQMGDKRAYEDFLMNQVFYRSDFYETESNNEILRVQAVPQELFNEKFKTMKGVQFVMTKHLVDQRCTFWVEKRFRRSPQSFQTVSIYYIVDFAVFQAATLAQTISNRLTNSILYSKKAHELISQHYKSASQNINGNNPNDVDNIGASQQNLDADQDQTSLDFVFDNAYKIQQQVQENISKTNQATQNKRLGGISGYKDGARLKDLPCINENESAINNPMSNDELYLLMFNSKMY